MNEKEKPVSKKDDNERILMKKYKPKKPWEDTPLNVFDWFNRDYDIDVRRAESIVVEGYIEMIGRDERSYGPIRQIGIRMYEDDMMKEDFALHTLITHEYPLSYSVMTYHRQLAELLISLVNYASSLLFHGQELHLQKVTKRFISDRALFDVSIPPDFVYKLAEVDEGMALQARQAHCLHRIHVLERYHPDVNTADFYAELNEIEKRLSQLYHKS